MVCAICGRTPLMMQSAPIRRIAVTVFSRCWATGVDRRHTGDIDDGDLRTGIDDALQQRFHHHRVRCESRVPIIGRASTPSHSLTTGVDSSSSSSC